MSTKMGANSKVLTHTHTHTHTQVESRNSLGLVGILQNNIEQIKEVSLYQTI